MAKRGHVVPVAVLVALAGIVAWLATLEWQPAKPRLRFSLPYAVSGDEPHYLVLTHSLLFDQDLFLENNYADARNGGPEAGHRHRGRYIDPHAYLVDYEQGLALKWHALYDLQKPLPAPDEHGAPFAPRRPNPFKPGAYRLLPAHPPAFSAVLAAALWPVQPDPERVESLAGAFLVLVAVIVLFAGYSTGLAAGLSKMESVLAVCLFALCSPWLVYTRSFFTEVFTSLLLLVGLRAYLRDRMLLAGAMIAAAVWIKTPYALVAAAWTIQLLYERRYRHLAVLAVPLACGVVLLAVLNWNCVGSVAIFGAGALSADRLFQHPLRPFFSLKQGLLPFVPWTAVVLMYPWQRGHEAAARSLAWPVLAPIAMYAVLIAAFGFAGGGAYAGRYWIPFLPWLAIVAVQVARSGPAWMRVALAVLALGGLAIAVPGVLQYGSDALIWRKPPHAAPWRMLGW
jgi:hypothetical protein